MRYFLNLSYDGSAYHGWQTQPGAVTVQETLEQALSTLLRTPTAVTGAGRTDAGVHARMMVAHMDAYAAPSVDRLNRLLPPDIVVHGIRPVRPDAHARFDALARTYLYYVTTEKECFARDYAMRLYHEPDFERMNEAAARLFDYTDFTSFSKLHTDTKTNNCRIMHAAWEPVGDHRWAFRITADRFLRNMVRAVVGTLLEVGRGRMTVDDFCRVVERRDRCSAGTSVLACGLFLERIDYPDTLFLPLPTDDEEDVNQPPTQHLK